MVGKFSLGQHAKEVHVYIIFLIQLFLCDGQPTLDTPNFYYCGLNDLQLTCNQIMFTGTGFSWKKDGLPVYNDGGDTSGTGRYSHTSTANTFTLMIYGAINDDGGAFVCNCNFQDSNSVTLQLYCPPTEDGINVTRNDQMKLVIDISHIYPNTATVTVIEDGHLLFGTTGTSTANGDYFDIQWISNDDVDDGTHTIRIAVVTRTTSTEIIKTVTFGKPSRPVLSMGSIPEIGGNLTFICSITSTKVPSDYDLSFSYTWFVSGQTNPSHSRYTYIGNKYTISNAQRTDKDKPVTCTATERINGVNLTSDQSNRLTTDVYYGPLNIRFNPTNDSYVLAAGTAMPTIFCLANCSPGCSYTWYKDGIAGPTSSNLSLGTYYDADTYSCRARRQGNAQTVEKNFTVFVFYGPFDVSPTAGTVYSGNIATDLSPISCSADCWECQYSWTGPAGVAVTGSGQNLTLTNMEKKHAGTYTCNATNIHSGISKSTYVIVYVRYGPESISLIPPASSRTIDEGDDLGSIVCNATCYPECTYVWRKQYQNNSVSTNKVLTIGNNVQRGKAGRYMCTATNPNRAGAPTYTVTLDVHVRYGPDAVSVSPPNTSYTVDEGGFLANIVCNADCHPACTYVWRKKDQVSIVSSNKTLSLGMNIRRTYAGTYACTASRSDGFGAQSTVFVHLNVRYGPESISLTPSVTSRTIDEGDNIGSIECNAACYPVCTYVWEKQYQNNTVSTNKVLAIGNNVQRGKAGRYTCTAINPNRAGTPTDTVIFDIYVRYGPDAVFVSPPNTSYTVDEGGFLANIVCNADCNPSCAYVWQKKDQASIVSSNKTLSLGVNIRRTYAGTYACTASRSDGFGSQSTAFVHLNVRYGPESISLTPSVTSRTIDEGDDLGSIECNAACYPECTYVWRKQYQNNTVSRNNVLTIGNNVRREKAGRYTCTATNANRAGSPTDTTTFDVFIRYGPDGVNLHPPQQSYIMNELETLAGIFCSTDCYPSCTIKWTRTSQIYDTAILSLGKLNASEAGNYSCMAINKWNDRSATKEVSVNVRYGPKTVMFTPTVTSPLTVVEGMYINPISCSSNCYPSCSSTWKKGTQITSLATGEVLSFGNVNRSYAGNFTCTSTNAATQYDKSLVRELILIVQYPPDAVIKEKNENPNEIILQCFANGEPPNYTFERWVHMAPDRTTEIQRYLGNVNGSENTLVIRNVTYMDSGVYICKVANNISTSTAQFGRYDKEVHISGRPLVIQDVREFYAKQHENVSMSVRVHSYDALTNITWVKLGNETKTTIESDNKYGTSVSSDTVSVPFYTKHIALQGQCLKLNIKDVDVGDYTEYEVHIANSMGEVVVLLVVKQRGPPEVPRNFAVLQDSERTSSIGFSWFPGFHGGADQTFHIEYKTIGQGWRQGTIVYGGQILSHQFQAQTVGLASGSSYLFRIYSWNIYGNSSYTSKAILGNTTKEEVSTETRSLIGPVLGGGFGAAALIVLLIVVVVFANRRWTNRTKGASMQPQLSHDRGVSMQYESIGALRDSSAPYDILNASTFPGLPQRLSGNLYDELDLTPDQTHVYTSLQVDLKSRKSDAVVYSNLKLTVE